MDIEAGGELTAVPGRRRRNTEERRLIVNQTLGPGASVARVARKHGVNATRYLVGGSFTRVAVLGVPAGGMTLLPVTGSGDEVLRAVCQPAPTLR